MLVQPGFARERGRSQQRGRFVQRTGGMGLLLGLTALMGTGAAVAQAPTNGGGDVVVDTEPQKPESKPAPTGGETTRPTTGVRFTCETSSGQPVVMYHPESQPGQSYAWAKPGLLGGGWTPERRCMEISRRLESYRPDGLVEMRTSVENNYNIVCVTTERVPGCRIVMTVPPGQDPTLTRDRVFENLTIADSGQQTQAVNSLTGRGRDPIVEQLGGLLGINLPGQNRSISRTGNGIYLKPFLDRADGGTGEHLRSTAPVRRSPRLNPDKFR